MFSPQIKFRMVMATVVLDIILGCCTGTATIVTLLGMPHTEYHGDRTVGSDRTNKSFVHYKAYHMQVDRRQQNSRWGFDKTFSLNFVPSIDFQMVSLRIVIYIIWYLFAQKLCLAGTLRLQCTLLFCPSHWQSFVCVVTLSMHVLHVEYRAANNSIVRKGRVKSYKMKTQCVRNGYFVSSEHLASSPSGFFSLLV